MRPDELHLVNRFSLGFAFFCGLALGVLLCGLFVRVGPAASMAIVLVGLTINMAFIMKWTLRTRSLAREIFHGHDGVIPTKPR